MPATRANGMVSTRSASAVYVSPPVITQTENGMFRIRVKMSSAAKAPELPEAVEAALLLCRFGSATRCGGCTLRNSVDTEWSHQFGGHHANTPGASIAAQTESKSQSPAGFPAFAFKRSGWAAFARRVTIHDVYAGGSVDPGEF